VDAALLLDHGRIARLGLLLARAPVAAVAVAAATAPATAVRFLALRSRLLAGLLLGVEGLGGLHVLGLLLRAFRARWALLRLLAVAPRLLAIPARLLLTVAAWLLAVAAHPVASIPAAFQPPLLRALAALLVAPAVAASAALEAVAVAAALVIAAAFALRRRLAAGR
jgi:hypothetical protein